MKASCATQTRMPEKKLRSRHHAFMCSANDIMQNLYEQGYSEEPKLIESAVREIQSQITNIKLTYNNLLSLASTSIMEERISDLEEADGPNDLRIRTRIPTTRNISSREEHYTHNTIIENLDLRNASVNQQMPSSDVEWNQKSDGENQQWTGIQENISSTVVSSTMVQPITSVSVLRITRVATDPHDKVYNTRNIATLEGCIPSTIAIPTRSEQHTHVITCNSPVCSTNVLMNTQSHFHVTSTHQPAGGTPGWPHIFNTTSRESPMPIPNLPQPNGTQEVQSSPREQN